MGVAMNANENRKSLVWGVSGIVVQIAGMVLTSVSETRFLSSIGLIVMSAGFALLTAGLVYYAKAKGRHPTWGFMGLLSGIGLIVLACLQDRAPATPPPLPSMPPLPPHAPTSSS
jgi:hypothetical protein